MNTNTLDQAARDLFSAAIVGGDWLAYLDPITVEMNALGGGPSRALPPDLFAIPTSGLRDEFVTFKSIAPPLTAADVIPTTPNEAFVADYMTPQLPTGNALTALQSPYSSSTVH